VPKKTLPIGKFDKGIINSVDKKDIPEGGVANASGLMFDIPGQVRQMGAESVHRVLNNISDITGSLSPGYGLFAFDSDFNVSDNYDIPSKMLAIQQSDAIAIINETNAGAFATVSSEVDLTNAGSNTNNEMPKPVFNYIDGELKICNSNFDHTVFDYPKTYKYMRKCWFQHESSAGDRIQIPDAWDDTVNSYTATNGQGDWMSFQSYIFPPSCASNGAATHQLYSDSSNSLKFSNSPQSALEGATGCISLSVACTDAAADDDTGQWTTGTYKYGISFQYDNGQESSVTSFAHDFATSNMNDNTPMAFKLFASIDSDTAGFDKRLSGVNLYWTGDGDGVFDDPLFLAYWHWGTSSEDQSYFEAHSGERLESSGITHSNDVYVAGGVSPTFDTQTNAGLQIKTIPSITFEIRNLYSNETRATAAKYKSMVIANRRAYIGGIKQYTFDTANVNANGNTAKQCAIVSEAAKLDRMIKSPVNQFDVFPDENFIDVAVNDGESITHLASYNGKLLQFKESSLYIINIAENVEYLESQHKYMGVLAGYQVTETSVGVAWVNPTGCFIYDGQKIQNIAQNLMFGAAADSTQFGEFASWRQFIGSSGMVGYIPLLEQLTIYQDPVTSQQNGHVLIYDLKTQSWAYGKNKCTGGAKSNVVNNYDNSCLYISQSVLQGYFSSKTPVAANPGIPARWVIQNLTGDGISTVNLKYTLGANDAGTKHTICDLSNDTINDSTGDILRQRVIDEINATNDYYQTNRKAFIVQEDGANIIITREAHLIAEDHVFGSTDVMDYSGTNLEVVGSITDDNTITIGQVATGEGTDAKPNYKINFLHAHVNNSAADFRFLKLNDWTGAPFLQQYTTTGLPWSYGPRTENALDMVLLSIHSSLKPVKMHLNYFDNTYPADDIIITNDDAWATQHSLQRPYTILTGSVYTGVATGGNSIRESYSSFRVSSTTDTLFGTSSPGVVTIGNGVGISVYQANTNSDVLVQGKNRIDFINNESNFYTDGSPLTTGTDMATSSGITGDYHTDKNQLIGPSVVFRNVKYVIGIESMSYQEAMNTPTSPAFVEHDLDAIVMTMMGDYTEYFSVGASYKLQNTNFNSIHGTDSGYLRNCTLSEVKLLSSALVHFDNNNSGTADEDIPGVHVTVLFFRYGDQVNTDSLDDNLYNKFYSVKSYGSQSDVQFTTESLPGSISLGTIDNNDKTGVATTPKKISLNPRYGGVVVPAGAINATITDHGGNSHSSTSTVTANDYIMDVSTGIKTQFDQDCLPNIPLADQFTSMELLAYANTVRWFIGNDGTDNGGLVRVALDLASEGVSVGDYVEWSTLAFAFYIKTIYTYGTQKDGSADAGYTWFEIDKTKTMIKGGGTDGNISSGTLITGDNDDYDDITPTDTDDHLLNSTVYPTARFSNIVVSGNKLNTDGPNKLEGRIVQTLTVNVNEFINDPGYANLLSFNSHEISLETKEMDFGSPGTLKALYYIDINYKSNLRDFNGEEEPAILKFYATLGGEGESSPQSLYTNNLSSGSISDPTLTGLYNTSNVFYTRRYYFHENKAPVKAVSLSLHIDPLDEGNYSINSFVINDVNVSFRDLNR